MKNSKKLIFFVASLSFLISGCTSVPLLQKPQAPAPVVERVNFSVPLKGKNVLDISEDVVYAREYNIPIQSAIVISVPSDFSERVSKSQKPIADKEEIATTTDRQLFTTNNYFNLAEQYIEKELIRNGFAVIDRSKLEQVLRETNASDKISKEDFQTLSESNISENVQEKITDAMLSQGLGNKLNDIADVITAAQNPKVNSDYVLQINKFDTPTRKRQKVDLSRIPKFRRFKEENAQFAPQLANEYVYYIYEVTFNAKLIEVNTGNILWIGDHTISSLDVVLGDEDLEMEIVGTKKVNDQYLDKLNKSIDRWNTSEGMKERKNTPVQIPGVSQWEYDKKVKHNVSPDVQYTDISKDEEEEITDQMLRNVTKELIRTITRGK